MLCDEVERAEGSDEGAGHGEHDGHAEEQHHSGVLLAEAKLVTNRLLEDIMTIFSAFSISMSS